MHTYSVMSCVNLEPQWDPIKEGKKGAQENNTHRWYSHRYVLNDM